MDRFRCDVGQRLITNIFYTAEKLICFGLVCVVFFLNGCVSKAGYANSMHLNTMPTSRRIEADALLKVECILTPEYVQLWKRWLNSDTNIANYMEASCDAIKEDMVKSRLFKRIVSDSGSNSDLLVKLVNTESDLDDKIELSIINPKTNELLANYNGEAKKKGFTPLGETIGPILTDIRQQVVADYEAGNKIKNFLVAKGTIQAPAPNPQQTITVKSDIDELPAVKVKANSKAYAIVIGIEQYRQRLPKADFAIQDAKLVTDYLTKSLGYSEENVITLLNENATYVDLVKYFERWLANNVEKGSTVFVYYSGHGAPDPKSGTAFLVPFDGDPSFLDETGYSLKRMYAALGKLPAKDIIVALDSCFSGAGGRSVLAKGARPLVMNLQSNVVLPKNMTVISASSGEQISSTYDEKGHGLFTYFMLKGIKNEDVIKPDGSIKMDDLFDYLRPQVERIARKQYNNEQTPQLLGTKR